MNNVVSLLAGLGLIVNERDQRFDLFVHFALDRARRSRSLTVPDGNAMTAVRNWRQSWICTIHGEVNARSEVPMPCKEYAMVDVSGSVSMYREMDRHSGNTDNWNALNEGYEEISSRSTGNNDERDDDDHWNCRTSATEDDHLLWHDYWSIVVELVDEY